ncbi:MAG: diacylglycerol kinase family protein [Kineosporiaceae bacterium]
MNPRAGKGRAAAVGERVVARCRRAGLNVEVVSGASAVAAAQTLRDLVSTPACAVVAVGGDGTAHAAANVLCDAREDGLQVPPLAVVPAGTGNDVAACLGFPADPDAAIARVLHLLAAARPPRDVDALAVEGGWGRRWVVGVIAAGFDAVVNERANGWRWPPGRRRYDLALLAELPGLRTRAYLLELPDQPPQIRSALLLAVANVSTYGGGVPISPGSDPGDGTAEVVTIGGMRPLELLRFIPRAYRGRHLSHPAVTVEPFRHVRVSAAGGRGGVVAYGDGERLGPLPLEVGGVPGALSVLA